VTLGLTTTCTPEERKVLDLIDAADLVGLTRALVDAGGENAGGTEQETVRVLSAAASSRGLQVRTDPVAEQRPNVDVGGPEDIGGWSAACDGGFIAQDLGVPTVVMGPGGLHDQAHQVDESVGVEELALAARAYALAALRLLST
jgi:hypothetical protein